MLALITTIRFAHGGAFGRFLAPDGLPISYEVFPGNTHEVQTLLPSIEKSREEADVDGKIAAKKMLKNEGKKRYLSFSDDRQAAEISLERVRADKKWDGIRGYVTNSSAAGGEVIASYRRLWALLR